LLSLYRCLWSASAWASPIKPTTRVVVTRSEFLQELRTKSRAYHEQKAYLHQRNDFQDRWEKVVQAIPEEALRMKQARASRQWVACVATVRQGFLHRERRTLLKNKELVWEQVRVIGTIKSAQRSALHRCHDDIKIVGAIKSFQRQRLSECLAHELPPAVGHAQWRQARKLWFVGTVLPEMGQVLYGRQLFHERLKHVDKIEKMHHELLARLCRYRQSPSVMDTARGRMTEDEKRLCAMLLFLYVFSLVYLLWSVCHQMSCLVVQTARTVDHLLVVCEKGFKHNFPDKTRTDKRRQHRLAQKEASRCKRARSRR